MSGESDPPAIPSFFPPQPLARRQGPAPITFKEGGRAPYGVRWYGITSLYGHFRNFVSRAIAAEAVDSRDWMRPASREETLQTVLKTLGAPSGPSVAEALGRPVFIDFVADTGDDRDTSFAVGAMLARDYTVSARSANAESSDQTDTSTAAETIHLPRGEILLMGGDVAYPVSTADEIHRRLTQPWNEALRAVRVRGFTRKRVLLGVPGNHDWYDGLDGFGRLFRKSVDLPTRKDHERPPPTILDSLARLSIPIKRATRDRRVGLVVRQLHLDEVSGFFRIFASIARSLRAFVSGASKKRRRRLLLHGYAAVQESSYFILPLGKGLDMWGVDRQLGQMDFRQRAFFQKARRRTPDKALVFLASDPASAFAEESAAGMGLLAACKLQMERDPLLYLSGDFHHYERRKFGPSMHIIAGGGGAFLHGTRIRPGPQGAPCAQYPSPSDSRNLVLQVPMKLLWGRGGYLVHLAAAVVALIELWARTRGVATFALIASLIFGAIGLLLYAIAGPRKGRKLAGAATVLPFAALLGGMPALLSAYAPPLFPSIAGHTVVLLAYTLLGTLAFGVFLMLVAILGYEHQQAFTVLGHHGFKHFVRLCVHPNGRVQGWVIGKDDPLAPGPASLIDSWEWSAPKSEHG
jgi:hypothetical protein